MGGMGPRIGTWLSKYRRHPTNSMAMETPRNVAPNGFPSCRSRMAPSDSGRSGMSSRSDSVVLRRKSCVIAMPIEAKASEVRSHARNVRSVPAQTWGSAPAQSWPVKEDRRLGIPLNRSGGRVAHRGLRPYRGQDGLARRSLCFPARGPHTCPACSATSSASSCLHCGSGSTLGQGAWPGAGRRTATRPPLVSYCRRRGLRPRRRACGA